MCKFFKSLLGTSDEVKALRERLATVDERTISNQASAESRLHHAEAMQARRQATAISVCGFVVSIAALVVAIVT